MNEKILKCDLCGDIFNCEHNMVNEAFGQKLKVPHCKKCFFDDGKCSDNHGYQCEKCQKINPEFNP